MWYLLCMYHCIFLLKKELASLFLFFPSSVEAERLVKISLYLHKDNRLADLVYYSYYYLQNTRHFSDTSDNNMSSLYLPKTLDHQSVGDDRCDKDRKTE